MRITTRLSDDATLDELGGRLARVRLARNLTQQELADEAGVSVDTVRRFERKQSITLTAFLRLLRALGQLDALDVVLPDELPSPIEQLERERRRRRRATGARGRRSRAEAETGSQGWEWGEQHP